MRSFLAALMLIAAASMGHAKATPYTAVITWSDGTTATLRTRQKPSTSIHFPPYTYGRFRCKGACPTRRGYAYVKSAYPIAAPSILFNGPNGKAAGPRCFRKYVDQTLDPVSGCLRDERTLHCTEAGVEAPPDGTIVIVTTPCRALLGR